MAKKKHRFPKEETPRFPMLSVCDLVVNRRALWGHSKPLLDQISFTADKGEIVALCGENGCGRTLLSKMILRIRGTGARITSGQIMIDQRDISGLGRTAMAPIRRKQLFYFSSDLQSQLNPELTVHKHLSDLITLSNRSIMYGNEANWDPVFYQVGIVDPEEILQKKCGELKPVTVLRVMLISAVFVGAKVIMADDPTALLDDLDRETFYQNLRTVAKERKLAVILNSGQFSGINRIADRIHIMFQARILESGTPGDLVKQARFAYTRNFIQCHPDLREKRKRLPFPDEEAISEAEQSISSHSK